MATQGGTRRRLLKKPSFPSGRGGYWVNPDYLAAEIKASLWARLPRRMHHDRKCLFLSLTGEAMQEVPELKARDAARAIRDKIAEVESKAHALLVAMNKLSGDAAQCLSVHGEALAWLTDPPARLSPLTQSLARSRDANDFFESALLSHLWDTVQDIETAARYAAMQVKPDKAARPSQMLGRSIARSVAEKFRYVTGKLPPGSKESWFPDFIRELGASVGVSIGPAMVASVLREMSDSGQFPDKEPAPIPPEMLLQFKPPPD